MAKIGKSMRSISQRHPETVGDEAVGDEGPPPPYDPWWKIPVKPGHSAQLGERLLWATAVWFVCLFLVTVILGALSLVI